MVSVHTFEDLDARTAYALWRLRQQVFVVEQQSPYPDLDGRDLEPTTRHVLAYDGRTWSRACGCSTTATHARIGRVAVTPAARGRGLRASLMDAALAEIGDREIRLDAQTGLTDWYAGYGFEVSGPEFVEDGVAAPADGASGSSVESRPRRPRRGSPRRARPAARGGPASPCVASAALKTSRSASACSCRVQGSSPATSYGRPRPACDRRQAEVEAHLVVREQLVDPGVRRRRDRTVGGQQREVGQPAHLGQRGHEVAAAAARPAPARSRSTG